MEENRNETGLRNCLHWLWLGALGLVLLALIPYFFGKNSAKNLRSLVSQTAQEALDKGSFGFAHAIVKDGLLIIEGTAPNEAAKTAACAAATKAFESNKMIGLPGIVGAIRCDITYAGEPVKTVAAAPVKSGDDCQAQLSAAATSGSVGFVLKGAKINAGTDLLDKVAETAKKCADTAIEVAGHTDSGGDDAMNMRLSQARAEAVRAYLITKGVAATQLSAKGYGETKPLVADNAVPGIDSPERAKNRRIEFNVAAKK